MVSPPFWHLLVEDETFLIEEYFNQIFTIYATSLANVNTQNPVFNFIIFSNTQFSTSYETPKSWLKGFSILQKGFSKIEGVRILFLEELPWFDNKKSDFMTWRYFF